MGQENSVTCVSEDFMEFAHLFCFVQGGERQSIFPYSQEKGGLFAPSMSEVKELGFYVATS